MKTAWIEAEAIRDITEGDPTLIFHPDVAALFTTTVPEEARIGDGWVKGKLVPQAEPEIPEVPPAPAITRVSPMEFKLLFTAQERVSIKEARASDALVDDFFSLLDDPRLTYVDLTLQSTQQALGYLTMVELLASGRAAEILSGELQ